jgi:hypothetical protein
LLALHRADAEAAGKSTDHVEYCERLLVEWGPEVLTPEPLLTGDDLKEMGLEPGPLFKKLLAAVRDAQLDATIRTRDEARQMVERLLRDGVPSSPPAPSPIREEGGTES